MSGHTTFTASQGLLLMIPVNRQKIALGDCVDHFKGETCCQRSLDGVSSKF